MLGYHALRAPTKPWLVLVCGVFATLLAHVGPVLAGSCTTDMDCDDDDPCTFDICNDSVCSNVTAPDFSPCSDGEFCNGFEYCFSGECTDGSDPCKDMDHCDENSNSCLECVVHEDCDNGNPCTVGACNDNNICIYQPIADDTPCPDAFYCNGEESCHGGVCQAMSTPCSAFPGCDEFDDSCIQRVNLVWRPSAVIVGVGETVQLDLYAVPADGMGEELLSGLDLIFDWDPDLLDLLGHDPGAAFGWNVSVFPAGVQGCNINDTWQDGQALYRGLMLSQDLPAADAGGLHVVRVRFDPLRETLSAEVALTDVPDPAVCDTIVLAGDVPGLGLTGHLGAARVRVTSTPYVPGDGTNDQAVTLADLPGFFDCVTGPEGGLPTNCEVYDFDLDLDVDLIDFAGYQSALVMP